MTPDTTISKYGLDKIESSPLDYWHHFLRPDREAYVDDEKTVFDKALRMAIFSLPEFKKTYVEMPKLDRRTAGGKSDAVAFDKMIAASGQIPLGFDKDGVSKYEKILKMRESVLKHKLASKLLENGGPVTMVWAEPESGVPIKLQSHSIYSDIVINIMSMTEVSQSEFQKEVARGKLHKKAALHIDATGCSSFLFLNIESKAPYKISLFLLDDRSISFGRQQYIENCHTYAECLQKNEWPGITERIEITSLPEWAFK